MKKIASLLLAAIIVAFGIGAAGGPVLAAQAAAANEKLVIYNWAEYIDEGDPDEDIPGLQELFIQYYYEQTGKIIEIEYNTFETNEEVVTKALLSDADMDLICPSEYTIQKLLKNNALLKINRSAILNYQNIDVAILETIAGGFGAVTANDNNVYDMTEFMVPYMWGTLGILYNTAYVTEEDIANGYGILWNKAGNPALNKKILMKDSVRDSYVAAVLYAKEEGRLPAGYEDLSVEQLINTVNKEMLAVAEEVLLEQSDILYGYEVDFGKDDLIQGNAYVDLAWSGDAIYAISEAADHDVVLDYYVPEVGGNVWLDGWVMPKSCKNVRAAQMFINFMCDPVNAVKNMMYIGYTSAVDKEAIRNNEEACQILIDNEYDIDEFFDDPIQYPEITESFGVMQDFGDEAEDVIMMWESIKPSRTIELVIIFAAVVGACVLAVGAYFFADMLKRRPRKIN